MYNKAPFWPESRVFQIWLRWFLKLLQQQEICDIYFGSSCIFVLSMVTFNMSGYKWKEFIGTCDHALCPSLKILFVISRANVQRRHSFDECECFSQKVTKTSEKSNPFFCLWTQLSYARKSEWSTQIKTNTYDMLEILKFL